MKIRITKFFIIPCLLFFFITYFTSLTAISADDSFSGYDYKSGSLNTVNGKFYAYIVLLYNENQHFVNLIQKGAISTKEMANTGFHIKAYKAYLATIHDPRLAAEAELMLKLYLEPDNYGELKLRDIEKQLLKRNIVVRFSQDFSNRNMPLSLLYIIYGEKIRINIRHPLVELDEEIYYIKPYIYYDEFSTSNTTLHYDLIYISPDEVNNDYSIVKEVLAGKEIKHRFYVGSKVTDDIRYCLARSFSDTSSIKAEIWKMLVIHELTHKYLDNKFRYFDQVTGEEISLSSTIYSNPYLGLSVMYSYLNYGQMNPHRIAAMNYLTYIAESSGNKKLISNPGMVKYLPVEKLREYTKNHFFSCINRLQQQ